MTPLVLLSIAHFLMSGADGAPDTVWPSNVKWSSEVKKIDRETFERKSREMQSPPTEYIEYSTQDPLSVRIRAYLTMIDLSMGLSGLPRADAVDQLVHKRGYSPADASELVDYLSSRRSGQESIQEICREFPADWRNLANLDVFAQYLRERKQREEERHADQVASLVASLSEQGRLRLQDQSGEMTQGESISASPDYQALLRDHPESLMMRLEEACRALEEEAG